MSKYKYRIKITRILPNDWTNGGEKDEHYYCGSCSDGGLSYQGTPVALQAMHHLSLIKTLSEQETRKIVKEIKLIYEKNSKNGKLLKIEVVDAETSKPVDMCKFEPEPEPEIIISRFELMEL